MTAVCQLKPKLEPPKEEGIPLTKIDIKKVYVEGIHEESVNNIKSAVTRNSLVHEYSKSAQIQISQVNLMHSQTENWYSPF